MIIVQRSGTEDGSSWALSYELVFACSSTDDLTMMYTPRCGGGTNLCEDFSEDGYIDNCTFEYRGDV